MKKNVDNAGKDEIIKEIESWKNKKGIIHIEAHVWDFIKLKFEK